MRAVIQRVRRASVQVQGTLVGEIGLGLLVLLAVTHSDSEREVDTLVRKVAGLRIFEDDERKMNRSVQDAAGAALVVSQFTLYADVRKGRRPSFTDAAPNPQALALYEAFCTRLAATGLSVEKGAFGMHMAVELVNDGPVTIWLDTDDLPNEQR